MMLDMCPHEAELDKAMPFGRLSLVVQFGGMFGAIAVLLAPRFHVVRTGTEGMLLTACFLVLALLGFAAYLYRERMHYVLLARHLRVVHNETLWTK